MQGICEENICFIVSRLHHPTLDIVETYHANHSSFTTSWSELSLLVESGALDSNATRSNTDIINGMSMAYQDIRVA